MEIPILEFASTRSWRERLVFEKPNMTTQNYLWALQVFCDWSKKTPDELMLERQRERSSALDESETASFKRIVEYQLADRSKTKHSKALVAKALASFYEDNRINTYDPSMTHIR
ncbi:MAG: hypothetical protein HYU39_01605 [Thaumarchaeota archaeon]|nr:hypothetical protein [Nitrososphaerota archaeon]